MSKRIARLSNHKLRKKTYWGNHCWLRGYCFDTVGLDAEKIHKYLKYQEAKERRSVSNARRSLLRGNDGGKREIL